MKPRLPSSTGLESSTVPNGPPSSVDGPGPYNRTRVTWTGIIAGASQGLALPRAEVREMRALPRTFSACAVLHRVLRNVSRLLVRPFLSGLHRRLPLCVSRGLSGAATLRLEIGIVTPRGAANSTYIDAVPGRWSPKLTSESTGARPKAHLP